MTSLSVVIPGKNEAENIPACLESLKTLGDIEIIYVDGGSSDGSPEIAKNLGASTYSSPPGRAKQMNLGASVAAGEILLFLHADTILPPMDRSILEKTLAGKNIIAGVFSLRFQPTSHALKIISGAANLRSRLASLPFGDQGLFLKKEVFKKLEGFRDLALMEDVDIVRRLGKIGKIETLPNAITTSSRRWQDHGVFRTSLKNQLILLAWRAGVSEEALANFYRGRK